MAMLTASGTRSTVAPTFDITRVKPVARTATAAWIHAGGAHHTVLSQALDSEQLEAAEMDGAPPLARFFYIILPHLGQLLAHGVVQRGVEGLGRAHADDGQGLAYALARRGHLAFSVGDVPTAFGLLQESLETCKRIGYAEGTAWPVTLLGQARLWGGDESDEVLALLEEVAPPAGAAAEEAGLITVPASLPATTRRIRTMPVSISTSTSTKNVV